MEDGDPIGIALRVGAAIEAVGGAYFVGGSLASSLQGDPRSTNDIDIVLEVPLGRIDDLVIQLGCDFEVDKGMLRDALLHGGSANIFFVPVLTKVDLFSVGPNPWDEVEFARRRPLVLRSGQTLVLKTPEDSVLRKLLWFREGGEASDRQWRDVVSVLRVSASVIDNAYLDQWGPRLRVAELLERARREATL